MYIFSSRNVFPSENMVFSAVPILKYYGHPTKKFRLVLLKIYTYELYRGVLVTLRVQRTVAKDRKGLKAILQQAKTEK